VAKAAGFLLILGISATSASMANKKGEQVKPVPLLNNLSVKA